MSQFVFGSQLALPAKPLLKIKSVIGVKNNRYHRVSVSSTVVQNATNTPRMTATFRTMSIPQKSIRLIFALIEDCYIK